jgi:hypothetical protein
VIRFALDEDFPDTILDSLKWGVTEADLVPMRHLDQRLRGLDDWELLLALHHIQDIDGLITTDSRMLNLPRELAVLHQTMLTLVVVERAGHDPIRAAGLLLVHLPQICKKSVSSAAQIWRLNAQNKNHESPWEELKRIAKHTHQSPEHLFQNNKLTKEALKKNPLARLPFLAPD